jgi:two-component SAPR family response regulator
MRAILIDDDKAMLIILKRLLGRMEGVTVAGSFLDGAEAADWLRAEDADIAFVDIQMTGASDGMALARHLLAIRPHLRIVFVTSHKEYALDAFDVGAVDYIVKPVRFERLAQTIGRIAGVKGAATASGNPATSKLTAHCLGGMRVYGPGGEVKWMSAKSAELFAYLLMHRDKGATRAQILEDLFDGQQNRQTYTYLYTVVYQLRRILKLHGLQNAVVSINGRYQLLPGTVEADFVAFEDRLAAIGEITASNYEQACETERLYTGDLFDEKGYIWSIAGKERLSALHKRFSHRLGQWLLEQGHIELAFPVVERLVARNETDEEANAMLLRLYAAAKDRHALIAHYGKYAKLVREELGLPPGAEMVRLFERLKDELAGNATE